MLQMACQRMAHLDTGVESPLLRLVLASESAMRADSNGQSAPVGAHHCSRHTDGGLV